MIYVTDNFAESMFQFLGMGDVIERGGDYSLSKLEEIKDKDFRFSLHNVGVMKYLKKRGIEVENVKNVDKFIANKGDTILVLKPSSSIVEYKTGSREIPEDVVFMLREWSL